MFAQTAILPGSEHALYHLKFKGLFSSRRSRTRQQS
jgi:hypothetical protein